MLPAPADIPSGRPDFSPTRAWNGGVSSPQTTRPGFGAAPIRTPVLTGSSGLPAVGRDQSGLLSNHLEGHVLVGGKDQRPIEDHVPAPKGVSSPSRSTPRSARSSPTERPERAPGEVPSSPARGHGCPAPPASFLQARQRPYASVRYPLGRVFMSKGPDHGGRSKRLTPL